MKKEIVAIIPVRKGSRRLKNKNIAPFADSNLLLNKIEQLKKVKQITNIVVSSDSDEMLEMASEQGVNTHKRGIEYSDDISKPFGEVVAHICEAQTAEIVLWATCTSPLVTSPIYSQAIEEYFQYVPKMFDSLISVEVLKRYIWDENGPINYKLGLGHVISQELPDFFVLTNGIFIAPRKDMITWKYFHGVNPYRFVVDKRAGVDIDDALDFEVAKAWLEMNPDLLMETSLTANPVAIKP